MAMLMTAYGSELTERGPLGAVPCTMSETAALPGYDHHPPDHGFGRDWELLAAIGCELVELPHPDQCCGSAGVYNVAQNELSMKILERKMEDVTSVSSDMLATANVGCMIQLRAGVEQQGLALPVKHVMELLDEAYT